MTVGTRAAAHGDLAAVVGLFEQYPRFYDVRADRRSVSEFIGQRLQRGDSTILLAESDGSAVGMAQAYPALSSLDLAPTWNLSDLFVAPAARGQGVGRALLRDVLGRAAAAGAVSVTLETAHTNTAAQALYESEGFVLDSVYRVYTRPVA